jgi:coenzyme F420-reducing hydrogenase beta subunit
MRLLIREQPEYAKQFVYFVGLVCGHLKSQFFAESIAWQSGVSPKNLKSIDFRVKQPGEKVSDYNYEIESKDGQTLVVSNSQVMESNWGYAAFQPGACNFCDDVFAETADVTLGDAWLEEYANEWRGTNVAVSRQPLFTEILTVASEAGILELVPIDPETAAQSQSGNFRHRRIALGVRLADSISKGELVPLKRVQPNYKGLSRSRLKLIRQRRVLSKLSLELFRLAKNEDSFEVYSIPMKKEISRYDFYSALDQGLLKTAVYLFERIFGKRISKSLRELRKK